MKDERPYDVVISFAGEDRAHAKDLADALTRRGVAPFYDQYEKAALWGKNLYTHLSGVYQNQAHYCVMFLSRHYAAKVWTNHEREAAQARAFGENREYILPVRLDDTEIPGVLPTVGYLTCPPETAETIADLVVAKLRSITGLGDRANTPDEVSGVDADAGVADIERDVAEAAGLARRVTTQGDPLQKWLESVGGKKVAVWRQAASRGVAGAQWLLGLCHLHGAGVERDLPDAVRLMRPAAEQGLPIAMAYLGWAYRMGWLGFKDYPQAVAWSRKATDLGEPLAQALLGECYMEGTGVEQDLEEGVRWLSQAASAGYTAAQLALGRAYMTGKRIERDPVRGFALLRQAAEQGDAQAEFEVGRCYYNGSGVAEDQWAAFKWFRRSADQGYADAQLMVGLAYAEGSAVERDHGEAVK